MSIIRHNAIVVSSWNESLLAEAHAAASNAVPGLVSEIISHRVNLGGSFLVAPDGSKEGWNDSDDGDKQRDAFIAWLEANRHDDGSTSLSWAEIAYSGDDRSAVVTRHAWQSTTDKSPGALP
jgi:hypothetical protein